MKKINISILSVLLSVITAQVYSQTETGKFKKIEGFSHPESVVYDQDLEVLYVSNMAGEKEGDGFISKVAVNGEILELKWVSGLNDPKGLLVHDGSLFVADNTELVEMDLKSAEIIEKRQLENSVMLNDVALNEGKIYISDTGKNSIFLVEASGKAGEWLSSEKLESPNGLLVVGNFLFVAAWGSEQNGNLLTVNRSTKEIQQITKEGLGNLDGIQRSGENSFYVSDWNSGKIYNIDSEGTISEIVTSARSVGDILFMQNADLLILPMNLQNEVWWYSLE